MIKLRTAVIGSIVAFLAGMLLVWAVDFGRMAREFGTMESGGHWSDETSQVPVSSNDPVWGSRSAPATLVVFSDFEAPNGPQLEHVLDQLKALYGRDKLRIVWKHNVLPNRKLSRPTAVAAETVRAIGGNEAFWKFHDRALSNQQALTADNFEKWAKQAGVKSEPYREAIAEGTFAAKVDADAALVRHLKMDSSPTVVINGVPIPNVQQLSRYREVIDAQIALAEQLKREGIRPNQMYVELTRINREHAGSAPRAAQSGPGAPATSSEAPRKVEPPPEDLTIWSVPIETSPIRGNKKAPVTVVVFSDYQCPFSRRTESLFSEVLKSYGDKVRIVWKDRVQVFHPRSEPAAEFAREARKQKGDAGFWAAHDKLFENNTRLDDSDLETYAKELELDVPKVKEAIAKKKYDVEIQGDLDLAEDLKVMATPHLFINGRRLAGGQSMEQLKKLIDDQLAKAEQWMKEGTPSEKIYDKVMASAVTPPPPPMPPRKEIPAPGKDNPFMGAANAKVAVQIFADFQCPYCKQSLAPVRELEQRYGRRVKIVWRNRPQSMHADARLAAEAALEAHAQKGNEGFWKFHDLLFENAGASDGLQRPALEKYAGQLGLDLGKFKAALDSHSHAAVVDADLRVAEAAGLNATPSFSINGYVLTGATPFFELRKVVVQALKEAK
ncbi:MAG: thioredoxin domain-containing protein [Deltaproteobacteria bacterium]|nr:thioredoxin domain-containing protein [Deltaproteobacteria bacterium]